MAARSSMLVVVITFLLAAPPAFSERRGFRTTMTRTELAINLTRTPLQLDSGGGAYDMTLSIGTPPQQLSALADTGSDLIWAKCGACKGCVPQGSPSYYPNKSSSFSKLPCSSGLCSDLTSQCSAGGAECDYKYSYGLASDPHHYTQGYLGSETFTLGSDAVPGIGFGCTTMSEGGYGSGSGLVSLGSGPLSLVSQLKRRRQDEPAPVRLRRLDGRRCPVDAAPADIHLLQREPVESISIGAATTAGTGSSGIIFDSGTTLTFLAEPAYTLAKAAVLSQTANLTMAPSRDGYEVCFQTSGAVFPSMVLHFDGGDIWICRRRTTSGRWTTPSAPGSCRSRRACPLSETSCK
ncbi:unnamed protein product [Miscanthus lutarioriparius]|uniref:Peptidase A1 domain-containing protein n=1 Tax=Miscanthus lutarioriparius TaxID=422564 RepID=A0A811QDD1_9POAL|nr:unnamed protein product [Miscanthus lutarioriparius]